MKLGRGIVSHSQTPVTQERTRSCCRGRGSRGARASVGDGSGARFATFRTPITTRRPSAFFCPWLTVCGAPIFTLFIRSSGGGGTSFARDCGSGRGSGADGRGGSGTGYTTFSAPTTT